MAMPTNRLILVTSLFLGACDAVDPADAPDRGALPEAIELRPLGATTGGGSTYLNTGLLFAEAMPLRHFARNGTTVTYDDVDATRVKFLAIKLVTGPGAMTMYTPSTASFDSALGRLNINGTLLPPGALLGSEWLFQVSNTTLAPRIVKMKITGVATATVRGDGLVPLYNFTLDPGEAYYGGPYSTCSALDPLTSAGVTYTLPDQIPAGTTNTFDVAHTSVLYGSVTVSSLGVVASSDPHITVACTSGAIGKSALWGYPSWASPYAGMSGIQQLQAASRAIRADYCHDGTSHTVDGTPVQIMDRYSNAFDDPTEATEAVWGGDGSKCAVVDNRLGSANDYKCGGVLTTDCRELGAAWVGGAESFMWTKAGPDMTWNEPQNDCDAANATPGCADPGVEAAVCAVDSYCCTTAWDAVCVNEVATIGAAADACCADNGGPGCGDAAVTACVGAFDSYCSATRWDSLCAAEVELLGCGLCH